MAYKREISSTRTHHLTVSGTKSYVVVLPVEFVRHLGWRERQKLDITLDGKQIVIKDWKG
jgi:bifunctional DNA-binding transcriptional regulator/antitoxin component of YhaV-PrlF toxin-antitoxin module